MCEGVGVWGCKGAGCWARPLRNVPAEGVLGVCGQRHVPAALSLSLSLFLSLSLSVLNPVLIPHDQTENRLGQGCRVQG